MSVKLPKILDYASDLPQDIHSEVRFGSVTPINSTTFGPGDEIIIMLPRAGSNSLLLPSYCKFRATVTPTTTNCVVSGTIDSIFSSLEVRHSGAQIEMIQNYETLFAAMFDSMVNADDRSQGYTITKYCSATRGTLTGRTLTAGTGYPFMTQFISGVVGTLTKKAFPINILGGQLELRIVLNNAIKSFAQATAANGWELSDVQFQMAYVQLPDQLVQSITRQPLSYNTRTYSNIEKVVAAATTSLEELLSFRYSSLNSIIVTMRPQSVITTFTEHVTSRNSNEISSYLFKVGSKNVPTNYVKGIDYGYIEPFEKLREALHMSGSVMVPGVHDSTSWVIQTNNDATGTFLIMQDFEKYEGLSDEVVSGEDTRNCDVIFSATFDSGTSIAAINLFDYYAEYNMTLVKDGSKEKKNNTN
jgi:hypothetical protein